MEQPISKILKVIYRNRWAATAAFLAVFGGLLAYISITPRLYSAKVRLILDDRPAASISPLGRDLAQIPGDNSKALATQQELVRSKKVVSKAIALYQQAQDNEIQPVTMGNVRSALETQIVPGTQIIEISFSHENPALTAALLNLIATSVVQENAETIRSEARATRKFLENQIPERQQQLVSIEAAISQFKQRHNIVSLENADNSRLTQSIADAEKTAEEISAQLRQVQARSLALSQVTGDSTTQETYQSTKAGQDPELISLREKVADLESQVNIKRESLTEDHPDIQQLLTELNATQLLYQEKLAAASNNQTSSQNSNAAADEVTQELSEKRILSDVERKELSQKLLSTQTYISKLNDRRQQFPALEKTLVSLSRQMETANQSVELLKQKLDEARIAEAQLVSNLRIIEEAEKPKFPSSPNIPSLLMLGFVVALSFSVGIILITEGLDSTLREPDDIDTLTELPVLGIIPQQSRNILLSTFPKADLFSDPVFLEAFRTLSKHIQYKNKSESKIVVVTSAIAGEGKSHIASCLATVSAMMSKKTLLVDADIRQPTIHTHFQLPLNPGLQEALKFSSEERYSPVIRKTSVRNLSVMAAGCFSYENIFSFESKGISGLLKNLEQTYDLIIVDTPPVISCADALTLSQSSKNQTMIVAKLNLTPKNALKRSIDILQSNDVNIVGLVINGGKLTTNKYYRHLQKDYALMS